VLLAQIARYENMEWQDKKGSKSFPVINDIEALHKFTNLSRPVDFAGRMVYNDLGQETFNFGKHKGKTVEDVFNIEPSYYAWMMQGDFPLYTKRKLEEIYSRWNTKKAAERQSKPVQPKPVPTSAGNNPTTANAAENPVKRDFNKPFPPRNDHNSKPDHKPFKKTDNEPAKPVNEDMLKMLADKFKKG